MLLYILPVFVKSINSFNNTLSSAKSISGFDKFIHYLPFLLEEYERLIHKGDLVASNDIFLNCSSEIQMIFYQ